MKHHVTTLFLLLSCMLNANSDKYTIADKSKRVGRFSYEDSFDEKLVETVLKNSPSIVKKNIKQLLYPENGEDNTKQRLLLLGGISNANTTAVAKAIALRCGYEYYLIEASALLKEYREGRQALLTEVRSVIKQGKPIAIIITELPEMADYSGLLASTLWLLIDQCEKYPDVLVIATSAFQQGQLSGEIKERFGGDIISVCLDQYAQKKIKDAVIQNRWIEKNKTVLMVAGGVTCLSLAAVHVVTQIFFAIAEAKRGEKLLSLMQEGRDKQDKQYNLQREEYKAQLNIAILKINIYDYIRRFYQFGLDENNAMNDISGIFEGFGLFTSRDFSEKIKEEIKKSDQESASLKANMIKKLVEFEQEATVV